MTEPFVGEIKMFGGNFAPRGFAFCNGQILSISQNEALFSLFGTIYGGDGRTTYGLPELRGRLPIHKGSGVGLPVFSLGSKGGSETEAISLNEMPAHGHTPRVSSAAAGSPVPVGGVPAAAPVNAFSAAAPDTDLAPAIDETTGGGAPHNNVMPFLCVNFIVALAGIYPSRA